MTYKLNMLKGYDSLKLFMYDINEIFGNNLLRLIKRKGLNQRRLAIQMNVEPSYINAIVKGKKYVSEGTLTKLCQLLNAEPHEFYIKEDTPIIEDSVVRNIVMRIRKYPEIKSQCDLISEALYMRYAGEDNRIQKKTKGIHRRRSA